jgi:hypothetical protein
VVVAKRAAGPFDVKLKPQSSDADPLGSTLARGHAGQRLGRLRRDRARERDPARAPRHLRAPAQRHDDAGRTATGRQRVPDSGTGELVGLAGTMQIDIADGKHSYVFEYTLPAIKT